MPWAEAINEQVPGHPHGQQGIRVASFWAPALKRSACSAVSFVGAFGNQQSYRGRHGMESESDLCGKRVVICEDEGVTVMQLERVLKRGGLTVVGSARNGAEAVDVVLQTRPDIVLINVHLGDNVDGIEAARRILAQFPTCIVMMSAYSDDATVQAAMGAGATGYLVKPLQAAFLLSAIADLWRRAQEQWSIAATVTLRPPKRAGKAGTRRKGT